MDVLAARLDQIIYTCGASELFDAGHSLEKKVFVKSALICGMPVREGLHRRQIPGTLLVVRRDDGGAAR